MSEAAEDQEYIPISHLNALAYCPRRYVYEFVQAEMLLNEHVVEGRLRHTGVDGGGTVWAEAGVQRRRVYVWSVRLGLAGFVDLVEERNGALYPVEYKKGRGDRGDTIQLCAQAMCLEERLGIEIPQGEIFSFTTRHRTPVVFDASLRAEVERLAGEARRLAREGLLPPPISQRAKCCDCSLQPLCLPDEVQALRGGATMLERGRGDEPA
jgi:CRISPR-associated exonuclease Cas4